MSADLFRIWLTVGDLSARDINHEFGELGRVARAFEVRLHAGFSSGRLSSSNVGTWVVPNQDSSPADFTVCVTGVRHQELCFSAFVLSAASALENCHHSQNMRLRRESSSRNSAALNNDGCDQSCQQGR